MSFASDPHGSFLRETRRILAASKRSPDEWSPAQLRKQLQKFFAVDLAPYTSQINQVFIQVVQELTDLTASARSVASSQQAIVQAPHVSSGHAAVSTVPFQSFPVGGSNVSAASATGFPNFNQHQAGWDIPPLHQSGISQLQARGPAPTQGTQHRPTIAAPSATPQAHHESDESDENDEPPSPPPAPQGKKGGCGKGHKPAAVYTADITCPREENDISDSDRRPITKGPDGLFHCPDPGCTKTFKSFVGAWYHRKRVANKREYKCNVEGCNKAYNTPNKMRDHYFRKHKTDVICPQCNMGFGAEYMLKMHIADTHVDQKLVCGIDGCTKTLPNSLKRKAHIRSYHRNTYPVFACRVVGCDETFPTQKLERRHFLEAHEGAECEPVLPNETRYTCPIRGCPAQFISVANCNSHVLGRHGIRGYKHKPAPFDFIPKGYQAGETPAAILEVFELEAKILENGGEPTGLDGQKWVLNIATGQWTRVPKNIRKVPYEPPFRCPVTACAEPMEDEAELDKHMDKQHGILEYSKLTPGRAFLAALQEDRLLQMRRTKPTGKQGLLWVYHRGRAEFRLDVRVEGMSKGEIKAARKRLYRVTKRLREERRERDGGEGVSGDMDRDDTPMLELLRKDGERDEEIEANRITIKMEDGDLREDEGNYVEQEWDLRMELHKQFLLNGTMDE